MLRSGHGIFENARSSRDYLSTSYRRGSGISRWTDVERNTGEHQHARIQSLIISYLLLHYRQFWSAVEARLRVSADRYRIPAFASSPARGRNRSAASDASAVSGG